MGTATRRVISIPSLIAAAVLLTVLSPVWLPIAAIADLIRGRWRLPFARLGLFAVGWAWLETAGVATAGVLWVTGQRHNQPAHHALQRWWAANLMRVLRVTTGIRVTATGVDALRPGPAVVLCRHASLADSLVSAWVITTLAGQRPRYVLKRELLVDPCLDVVGNRLPNYFLDRGAADSAAELDALRELAVGMGPNDVAVIFPEGTRSTAAKRARAVERIADRDPSRLDRVRGLRHLLPVRPAGSAALLAGCPAADVVIAWHVGFDGLDTFGGIIRHLAHRPAPVHFEADRFPRREVPDDPVALTTWLDERWCEVDDKVHEMLAEPSPFTST
jgi:1-acyl-sn-glycerol-3-phosphate acyltransferase